MHCLPYHLTLQMFSFHVTYCARIEKISCTSTRKLSNSRQRFPEASCNFTEGFALMTVAYKSTEIVAPSVLKTDSTVSKERDASNFRIIRYTTSLLNRHDLSGLIVYGAVHYISQTGTYIFASPVYVSRTRACRPIRRLLWIPARARACVRVCVSYLLCIQGCCQYA
jgi:hypothetical protein